MIKQKIIDNKILDWITTARLLNPITICNQVIDWDKRDIRHTMAKAFSMVERWDLIVTDVIIAPQVRETLKIFIKEINESFNLWGAQINVTNMDPNNILLISDHAFMNENLNKDNRYVSLCQIDFDYLKRISNLTAFW